MIVTVAGGIGLHGADETGIERAAELLEVFFCASGETSGRERCAFGGLVIVGVVLRDGGEVDDGGGEGGGAPVQDEEGGGDSYVTETHGSSMEEGE